MGTEVKKARPETVAAVMEAMDCVRRLDGNGNALCAAHFFGWLSDVDACPHAERVADAAVASLGLTEETRAELDAMGGMLEVMGEVHMVSKPPTMKRRLVSQWH